MKHRGRDLNGILHQYLKFVKPSFEEYILPVKTKKKIINILTYKQTNKQTNK